MRGPLAAPAFTPADFELAEAGGLPHRLVSIPPQDPPESKPVGPPRIAGPLAEQVRELGARLSLTLGPLVARDIRDVLAAIVARIEAD
jgi:hypothetical protein